jgi:hypothetical protein
MVGLAFMMVNSIIYSWTIAVQKLVFTFIMM